MKQPKYKIGDVVGGRYLDSDNKPRAEIMVGEVERVESFEIGWGYHIKGRVWAVVIEKTIIADLCIISPETKYKWKKKK